MIFWHNGNFFSEEKKQFSAQERLLRYGDGFFESMLCVNARPLWVAEHYARIVTSANVLHFELPKYFTQDFFEQLLNEMVQKNEQKNVRFRVVIYRKGDGLYAPQTNEAGIFITCSEAFPANSLNVIDKMIVYSENRKASGSLSNVKSCNALLFVMASIQMGKKNAQEAVILNSENNVCEAISANIFIIKNNQIITPPLSAGCVAGVVRSKILENWDAQEKDISMEDLREANAVFLTNVSKGIQAVRMIDAIRYDVEAVKKHYAEYQKMIGSAIGY